MQPATLKADRERGVRDQIAQLIVRYESVTPAVPNGLLVHNVSGHDFHNAIATEYRFRGSQQRPSRLPTFRRCGRAETAIHAFRRGLGISLCHGEEDRVDLPHPLAPRSYIIVFATDARGRRGGVEGRTGHIFRVP